MSSWNEEIRGLEAQRVSKEEQARLIKLELADLNKLLEKKAGSSIPGFGA